MRFVDVKNDIAFRKIFGNENRKECLISFLNAVLVFKGKQRIVSVEILNPYQLPKLRDGKVTIIDVRATDQLNRSYIVEMQVGEEHEFGKRALYYASKSYSGQIKRGDFYRDLHPVIFIGILNFNFTKSKKYISRHRILDVETHEEIVSDLEFNFIELPKFNKTEKELKTLTDKWIYFIKNAENLEVVPDNVKDEGLKIAYDEANKFTWTDEELHDYDYTFMREAEERSKKELAFQRELQQALDRELQKAEEKALKTGIDEGESKKQIEVAQNMIREGFDNATISRLTGLSVAQIQQLRKEMS